MQNAAGQTGDDALRGPMDWNTVATQRGQPDSFYNHCREHDGAGPRLHIQLTFDDLALQMLGQRLELRPHSSVAVR